VSFSPPPLQAPSPSKARGNTLFLAPRAVDSFSVTSSNFAPQPRKLIQRNLSFPSPPAGVPDSAGFALFPPIAHELATAASLIRQALAACSPPVAFPLRFALPFPNVRLYLLRVKREESSVVPVLSSPVRPPPASCHAPWLTAPPPPHPPPPTTPPPQHSCGQTEPSPFSHVALTLQSGKVIILLRRLSLFPPLLCICVPTYAFLLTYRFLIVSASSSFPHAGLRAICFFRMSQGECPLPPFVGNTRIDFFPTPPKTSRPIPRALVSFATSHVGRGGLYPCCPPFNPPDLVLHDTLPASSLPEASPSSSL